MKHTPDFRHGAKKKKSELFNNFLYHMLEQHHSDILSFMKLVLSYIFSPCTLSLLFKILAAREQKPNC